MSKIFKIRLKKGDTVIVRSGKYKGRTGKITTLHPRENRATVEGINIVKRHRKPTRTMPQGGIVEYNKPMDISKLGIYDAAKKKPSRVGMKVNSDGGKVRVMKTAGKEIK